MRWFRTHGKQSSYPVSGSFYNACAVPFYYNNILYGTEANPYYRVEIRRPTVGSTYSRVYPVNSSYYEQLQNAYLIGSPTDEDFKVIDNDLFDTAVKNLINMDGRINVLKSTILDISSTEIKKNINNDAFLKTFLHEGVVEYIKQNGLYNGEVYEL